MDAQSELNRLASALAHACPGATIQSARLYTLAADHDRAEFYVRVIVESRDGSTLDEAKVVTRCRPSDDDAVAELRAILRADTDGAVAEARRDGAEAMREECVAACADVADRWELRAESGVYTEYTDDECELIASGASAAGDAVRSVPLPGGAFVRTDEAIAAVLDELAAEAERGPITAEMLRTMAAARRAK